MNLHNGSHRSLSRLTVFLFIAGLVFTGIIGYCLAKRVSNNYQALQGQASLVETVNQDQLSSLTAQNEEQAALISALQVNAQYKGASINNIYSTLSSLPKGNLTDSGTLSFDWQPDEINASIMLEGENVSLLSNDSGYITASTTDTLTNKTISALSNTISGLTVSNFSSPNNSQWTNNAGYITASSLDNLTNKSGNISMWTNDVGYFANGGNAFGALATLGTTDANGLAIITSNVEAARILANGNFGIGSNNPGSKLVVYDATTSNGTVASFTRNSKTLGLYSDTSTFSLGTDTNTGLGFYTNGSANQMILDTSGRLGIGVTPSARVEINSGVAESAGLKFTQLTSSVGTSFTNGKVLTVDVNGNVVWAVDQVGGGGALPAGALGQTLYHTGVDWAATSNLYNTGGRVGIGSTSPQDMLHVYGTDNAPGDGITPQHNSIIIDGVADGDKNLIFADAGSNKWAQQIYRDEAGEFLYYYNYNSQKEPLVLSETGRLGLNSPSSIMNYHAEQTGTGLNDMDVGGNYTGEFQLFYQVEIDGTGTPDTYRWRTSRDEVTWSGWTSGVNITGLDQNLNNGVTIKFNATTGHTLGDLWNFTAFAQLPRATLSVGPGMFDEVLYFDGANYTDETYNANDTAGVALDLLTSTNDYTYFGMATKFHSIYLNIEQAAVGATLVVEYWSGAAWTPMDLATHNLQDFTNNLTQSGQITFDKGLLTGWAKNTVYDYVDLYYWIRISSSTNPSTDPTYNVASPSAKNRIGVYAGGLDTDPSFAVNALGDTNVGHDLSVAGLSTFTGLVTATAGITIGAGQSYTGAGAVNLSSAAGTALSMTSGTTGAVTVDSGTTGAINIGTGANAKTITIGNVTTTTAVEINSGTGDINLNPTVNDTHVSGGYGSTGVTISNTGNIQANGGLTIDGTSTLTGLASGTAGFSIADGQAYTGVGAVTLSSAAGSALNIFAGTTGALTLDTGTTGAINLGTGASAKTITIGNAASTAVVIAKLTTQYGVLYTSSAGGALAQTAAGSTGQCLVGTTGGAPTWASCSSIGAFTKTGTNISPTTAGDDLLLNAGETLTIGGGTAITNHLSGTASLNFPAIPNNACSSLTIAIAGAVAGNTVYASPTPVASGVETFTTVTWNSYVSAANTVTVRACKMGTGTADPAAQTWRADVWQH